MALVLSPWLGRGCGQRRTSMFGFGSPSLFTDFVLVKVPLQRQSCCAPQDQHPAAAATSNARAVQWAETPEAHIFTLRLPGLKKEDVHIQIEDDRILYVSYSNNQQKEGDAVKEGEAAAPSTSQPKEQARGSSSSSSSSFLRKFKLPENADSEQIKAEVTNETLTVTVPNQKRKSPEVRKFDVTDGAVAATPASNETSTSTA